MKSLFTVSFSSLVILIIFFSGCDLITDKPERPVQPAGNDLVISEVFTISPDKYYAYSWIELYNPSRRIIPWFEYIQPANAFVVGKNGTILFSNDNGENWETKSLNQLPAHIRTKNFHSVTFNTFADGGVIVGDSGYIIRVNGTALGDFSFDTVSNPKFGKTLRDVYFLKETGKAGWAVGDSCTIIGTSNLGKRWVNNISDPKPTNQNLQAIHFQQGTKSWIRVAVGDSGTILRSTKLTEWNKITPEGFSDKNFYDVCLMVDTGWIVGENGSILFSKSAGLHWIQQDYPRHTVPVTLRNVFFKYGLGQTGWIVGDNGVILKTTDFGGKWELKESGVTNDLYYVEFVDRYRGWAFGKGGMILTSEDGGETWTKKTQGNEDLNYAYFADIVNVETYKKLVLEIYAKRKYFFYDPVTGTINFSIFTKIDTGYVIYDPYLFTQFGIGSPAIPPDRFGIIINDSTKFSNHHRLGPSKPALYKFSIAYYFDKTAPPQFIRPVLWDLLSTGEVRLVRYAYTADRFTGQPIGVPKRNIIDIVRWGNFTVTDSIAYAEKTRQIHPSVIDRVFPYSGESPFMGHKSAGFIPEWYSLARFANDLGKSKPEDCNTAESFYMTKDPIAGWYSQQKK